MKYTASLFWIVLLSVNSLCQPLYDYSSAENNLVSVSSDLNIVYAVGATELGASNKELHIDAYISQGLEGFKKVALLNIHGGSFVSGNKSNMRSSSEYLAARGVVSFSMQYRLKGDNPSGPKTPGGQSINAVVVDAKTALRWIHAHADTYGIDTNNIFIGGSSAGAITALLAGVSEDDMFMVDLKGDPVRTTNSPGHSMDVQGIIDFGARLYDPKTMSWMGRDPGKEFHTPYLYAANNPLRFIDMDGRKTNDLGRMYYKHLKNSKMLEKSPTLAENWARIMDPHTKMYEFKTGDVVKEGKYEGHPVGKGVTSESTPDKAVMYVNDYNGKRSITDQAMTATHESIHGKENSITEAQSKYGNSHFGKGRLDRIGELIKTGVFTDQKTVTSDDYFFYGAKKFAETGDGTDFDPTYVEMLFIKLELGTYSKESYDKVKID